MASSDVDFLVEFQSKSLEKLLERKVDVVQGV
jgi:predicted nucleotidyltransferase